MYRIIPLRMLRRTPGVKFDEMVPSDIPKISGIDRVIHGSNFTPGVLLNIRKGIILYIFIYILYFVFN